MLTKSRGLVSAKSPELAHSRPHVPFRTGLFRHQGFRRLFWAQAGSQLSVQSLRLILSLVAIQTLNASQSQVSLLVACLTIAFPIIGLPVGAFVDRSNRRRVMLAADLTRGLALAMVPLLWWLGALEIAVLYAVALFIGAVSAFFDLSYQSYLPELVGRDNLIEGNARLESVRSASQVAGPPLGGVLVQVLSAPLGMLMVVGGFLFSAVSLLFIRSPDRVRSGKLPRDKESKISREISEGLKFVLGHPLLRQIIGNCGLFNLFVSAQYPVYIYFLARDLKLSGGSIGVLMALAGVGGILGSVCVKPLSARIGANSASGLSLGAICVFMLALPLAQPGWRLILVAFYQVVSGFGAVVYNVNQISRAQVVTPERMLGRMNASSRVIVWGTVPLGSLLGGELVPLAGIRLTLLVCALGAATAFFWLVLYPVRSEREFFHAGQPSSISLTEEP